jgi:FMN-dependent NADH-azoreductase
MTTARTANLLFVSSSLFNGQSKSREIAGEFIAGWRRNHPGGRVVERALAPSNMPHLSGATLAALGKAPDIRTQDEQAAVAFADSLIAEAEAADTIVIAAPMYNFTIPTTLKAWIDHIARAGRTFRYTAQGPEGLLKNKKVVVVVSRGGFYTGNASAAAMDHQAPYLRTVLGFLGLTDVSFVEVEGQAIGPDIAAKGLDAARAAAAVLAGLPPAGLPLAA